MSHEGDGFPLPVEFLENHHDFVACARVEVSGRFVGEDDDGVVYQGPGNGMPEVELKMRRVGGANFPVPTEVSPERKVTLGLRWLVNYSRLRNEKTMTDRLANEIIDAANGTGASVKKREDTHKMAEANKAYSHYRW